MALKRGKRERKNQGRIFIILILILILFAQELKITSMIKIRNSLQPLALNILCSSCSSRCCSSWMASAILGRMIS